MNVYLNFKFKGRYVTKQIVVMIVVDCVTDNRAFKFSWFERRASHAETETRSVLNNMWVVVGVSSNGRSCDINVMQVGSV